MKEDDNGLKTDTFRGPGPEIVTIPRIEDYRGNLSFIQRGTGASFVPRSVSWVYEVPSGRGSVSGLPQDEAALIVALSGSLDVMTGDSPGEKSAIYSLRRPDRGVVVPEGVARVMDNFSTNAVMLILSSAQERTARENKPDSPECGAAEVTDGHISTLDDCSESGLLSGPYGRGKMVRMSRDEGLPFVPRRVFYLYDVPAGESRGGHAHYQARELIVAAAGAFEVTLDDGTVKRTFRLDRPDKGLYVARGIWRELGSFSGGAVCLVMTSEDFAEADYIREYEDFLKFKKNK